MPAKGVPRGAARPMSFPDKLSFVWFLLDAITHFFIEGPYVLIALGGGAVHSTSVFAPMWIEYAKADARWGVRDPTVISLELLTVFILGPLCMLAMYAIWARKPYRHLLQVCISLAELYGGWMTFCPEWVDGSPSLNTSNPVYHYIYLWFMNGLWVVIPAVLLYDSGARIIQACDQAKLESRDTTAAPTWAYVFCAACLALYVVLVPAVLLTMQA